MSEMTAREQLTAAAGPPTCRWEYENGQRCTRPPAPRRGARGPAPVYCEQADSPGQPVHNPLNAWQAQAAQADAEAARADAASARTELRDRIIEHDQARQAIRQEADQAIRQARAEAAEAIQRAEADADAAVRAAETRIAETEQQARELADRARADAEALVRAAEADRDQARGQAEQYRQAAQGADQRAAAAE